MYGIAILDRRSALDVLLAQLDRQHNRVALWINKNAPSIVLIQLFEGALCCFEKLLLFNHNVRLGEHIECVAPISPRAS